MKKLSILVASLILCVGIVLVVLSRSAHINVTSTPAPVTAPAAPLRIAAKTVPIRKVAQAPALPVVVDNGVFHNLTLKTTHPLTEIVQLLGQENAHTTLMINRIDASNLKKGTVLAVPDSFDDSSVWEFMPGHITAAETIPKLIVVSQLMQSFGAYEFGNLVRSGPVSSGKKSTPTPSRLYFANWKGKLVVSSFSDEWVLNWNTNIDNYNGISMHQYDLPGFPASHSCVRLYTTDAQWIYNWADEWHLDKTERVILKHGTPVIVYGKYDFAHKAPWKKLSIDSNATKISADVLESLVREYLPEIEK